MTTTPVKPQNISVTPAFHSSSLCQCPCTHLPQAATNLLSVATDFDCSRTSHKWNQAVPFYSRLFGGQVAQHSISFYIIHNFVFLFFFLKKTLQFGYVGSGPVIVPMLWICQEDFLVSRRPMQTSEFACLDHSVPSGWDAFPFRSTWWNLARPSLPMSSASSLLDSPRTFFSQKAFDLYFLLMLILLSYVRIDLFWSRFFYRV